MSTGPGTPPDIGPGTPPGTPAPRAVPPRVPAAERGATRIADRVVAKIAAQAAREALDVLPGQAPHAAVTVHHDIARVRVSLELAYPSDLATQCADVRRRVALRIEECAGMTVPEVDIDIEHLHPAQLRPASAGRGRRLR
ncbi:Asp23/Gls24 family envelope stress response protein [Streptomyces sp. M-16]|uniref:Asp23/Gls24 family envelope stress response protein n=1 Tax=Streptomyces sp. M-16 TaxID=3233040 RepID=UPI003F945D0F